MKTLYTTLLLFIGTGLFSQYDDVAFGAKAGLAIGKTEEGSGYTYGFDLQKHLALGIYGIVSFDAGHMEDGETYVSECPGDEGTYQAKTMRQFFFVGLGLRKELKVNPNGRVSLGFKGLWVTQNRVDWNLLINGSQGLNLNKSQEFYSRRDDIGYGITGQYLHRMNEIFSLGLFASYQSRPEIITAGVRVLVSASKRGEEPKSSDGTPKNWMEFRLGSLGGDGVSPVVTYTVEYGRQFSKRLSAYTKFAIGQGISNRDTDGIISRLSSDDLANYERDFLSDDNEAGVIILLPTQSITLGVGVKFQINSDERSVLSLSGGLAFYRADVMNLSSYGSKLESLHESFIRHQEWLPEIGLHYDNNLSDFFYLGGKVHIAFNRYNFGVGVHGGIRF